MTDGPDKARNDELDKFVQTPEGVLLCYRDSGRAGGTPVLLLAGLGLQLISWPGNFVNAFTKAGCRVITLDNRDVGRSSRIKTAPPSRWRQLLARPPKENYSLEDMADNVASLLRHLQLTAAHVVGMSMGGMIGQALAARHPQTVASLTSIFSTTGAREVGQPARSTLMRIARSSTPRSNAQAVQQHVTMMRHIGDAKDPDIEYVWSNYASEAWSRNGERANASGVARQIGAIQKSGDRTASLRRITAPTLVIHGDIDLMVAPSGGRATAAAIPEAKHVVIKGMRHQIDAIRSPDLAARILSHIRKADASRPRLVRTAAAEMESE